MRAKKQLTYFKQTFAIVSSSIIAKCVQLSGKLSWPEKETKKEKMHPLENYPLCILPNAHTTLPNFDPFLFLAVLAALYLTLVSE